MKNDPVPESRWSPYGPASGNGDQRDTLDSLKYSVKFKFKLILKKDLL